MSDINLEEMIFVFGSNTAGIHGAGAAEYALKNRGAKMGIGYGHVGQSYAVPTKGHQRYKVRGGQAKIIVGKTLDLNVIQRYVNYFIKYAQENPNLTFQVTCLGCGLAGLKHSDIAPMFESAPMNCYYDLMWKPHLKKTSHRFWGTY